MVRGNTVSDLQGASVTGIRIASGSTVRAKNNKALRMRATSGTSTGFKVRNCTDVLLVYNVASRCDVGFDFESITTLNVYNMTSHNCDICVKSDSSCTFRNIVLSTYEDWKYYNSNIGFDLSLGATLNIDYMLYDGIGTLYSGGSVTAGDNIDEELPIYMDEPNDDLTPDHISLMVKTGTDNPLRTEDPSLGGIQSEITDEETAVRNYQYDLIDNSFWDVENEKSPEMTFIRAFQSRILANSEAALYEAERDYYIKTASSLLGFSELYPMYSRYANQTKFKKRVMDMWFAGQNPATLTACNNAIGGYFLRPSFFQRCEDAIDSWVLGESDIDIDNFVAGSEEQKYGIIVDVLGTMTLSQSTSGECYKNVQETVSDVAPVYWNLHESPQPSGYLLFTDLYNGFEQCTLDNMVYNDDFNVNIDVVQTAGSLTTPLVDTLSAGLSGEVELSVLDRVYSENVSRIVYYRQGDSSSSMSGWTQVEYPIGERITLTSRYLQFRIAVRYVLRQIDYEFMGLCLRNYETKRVWTPDSKPTLT
jgi:hypothetical protein